MRTPIPVACGLMLGLLSGALLPLTGWTGPLALAALASGVLAFASAQLLAEVTPARWVGWLLVLGAFVAGVALAPPPRAAPQLPPAGVARMIVVVEESRHGQAGLARTRVRVQSGARLVDGAQVPPGTALWVEPWPLPEGATLRLLASIAPQVPFRNLSPHPPLPASYPTQGRATLPARDAVQVLSHATWPRALNALRSRVRAALQRSLPDDAAAVARALILGDPDSLGEVDANSVRASGMAHVFAVSGMHVTLLAGTCVLGLGWLLLRVHVLAARFEARRIAAGIGVPLALLIAQLTGGSPSGVRAAVTTAIAWTLLACGRRPHAGAVTAAACILFTAVEPRDALRPAFLLSIAATAAIVAAAQRTPSNMRELVADAGMLSVRTSLATAPLVLWAFGTLPVTGVIANLVLVPVGSLLLLLAALHAALATLAPALSGLTAGPFTATSRAFLAACDAFARASPALTWPVLDVWQGVCVALATCVVLFAARLRTRVLAVGVALVCIGLLELRLRWAEQPRGELRVSFLDVGQGDAALVDFPDGRSMLIDAGGNPQGGADPGEKVLVPMLRARRRSQLDVVVLSHPHPDHYGGLGAVLGHVRVGELWDSGQAEAEAELEASSAATQRLLTRARAAGTRVLRPSALCGVPRVFGGAVVEVLWPCPSHDSDHDANDNSLVLRITYGARSFLFTGDVEAHAESKLVAHAARLRADVLKVPHHGSRTSSSDAFVRAVSPLLAVISAGATNRFGHPHPEVVQRLDSLVSHSVDIGRAGGCIVTTDGDTLRWRTWSEPWAERRAPITARAVRAAAPARSCVPSHMRPVTSSLAPLLETDASTANGAAQSK